MVAVIITVFNRKSKTANALKCISNQKTDTAFVTDTYVTDGGSRDGTVEMIIDEFPDVDVEVKEGVYWNRGMFHSWDRAASKQAYNYYLWLNDDVKLYDNCLQELIDASETKNNQSIIVGATVDSFSQCKLTYGGRIKGKGIPELDGELTEVDYFNGNIVLIPAAVYDKLGNLDYYFTHSKGDFDYGQRAKRAGIKMYQVGKALGECDEHPRIDKWCDPEVPLRDRLKMLYRPNGMPPHETFHLERKENICIATIHYFTVHLRCLMPWIWTKWKK